MLLQHTIVEHAVSLPVVAEVDKRLIKNESHISLLTPCKQSHHAGFVNEIARRIVGVNKQQCLYGLVVIESHQVIGIIFPIGFLGNIGNYVTGIFTIWVFFKGWIYNANTALDCCLGKTLNEFGGTIAHNNIIA